MAGRTLVLGGGGLLGLAWETGVAAGLLEGGVDLRGAERVIGTSAGSILGAWIASGLDLRERAEAQRRGSPAAPGEAAPSRGTARPDPAHLAKIFRAWADLPGAGAAERRVVGELARAAPTAPEERSRAWIRRELVCESWPAALEVTAIDAETGELRVFDAASGVELAAAVAASCCVPGYFAPVTIAGRRYVDGGVRSMTNADLAAAGHPDRVLVIHPLGDLLPGLGRAMQRALEQEVAELGGAGIEVATLCPDAEEQRVMGFDYMSPARCAEATELGRRRGRREAASGALAAFAG